MKELELYIHIPFCVRKCKYCDFLSAPASQAERQRYVESLCLEIRSYKELAKAYHVVTIFIGGGTPSTLETDEMKDIFLSIRKTFTVSEDAEITVEINPGTVSEEKFIVYKELGINRLSIGLQSANNHELRMLGRIHTYEEFVDTYVLARKSKFQNINIDLISAIPFQTIESWEDTLQKAALLEPEHISAYSLIIEEGTPFYERYKEGKHKEELPEEEAERQMYASTNEILAEYGYNRYEISNYAKEGYECKHNLGYWERKEYLGVGAGAASLIDNKRWVRGEKPEILGKKEQMEEFMFLGLRKIKGISITVFEQLFSDSIWNVYGKKIETLCQKELLKTEKDTIWLTEKGIDISNYVLSEFLID